jgi:hypothetical protein
MAQGQGSFLFALIIALIRLDRDNLIAREVVIDQRNFFIVPHVLAINLGQAVAFRNERVRPPQAQLGSQSESMTSPMALMTSLNRLASRHSIVPEAMSISP